MKKRLLSMLLVVCMVFSLLPAIALTANAAEGDLPTALSVLPSDTNGIPAQIDAWKTSSSSGGGWPGGGWPGQPGGGGSTSAGGNYDLYLPGNVDPAKCFFSWDNGLQATVDGQTYASGACPIPAAGETKAYAFTSGSNTATFTVTTWKGSENVKPIFIDIDESQGTIAAMDNDPDHETSCTGIIYIDGVKFTLDKIKGRGNYTWSQARDKKAYNITLGEGKVNLLGIDCEKTDKWSILGEVADHSLLCNRTGFAAAHQMDIGQDTTSADVWMNGEYQGCYTVTPKYDSFVSKDGWMIENDNYKESLTVAEGGDPQFALEGLNGVNNQWGGGGSDYNLITVKKMGSNFVSKYASDEAAAAAIQSWLQDAWDAIRATDGYNSKGKYYTDYIDIESFAKMYLMHEYIKSYDICAGSIMFHRDGTTDADKLIAGPSWDLDNALGSTQTNGNLGTVGDRRSGRGAFISEINEYKTSIYKTIGRHEDFMEEVYRQYNRNRAAFDALPNTVQTMMDTIEDSAKMNHNKVENINYNNHSYSRDTTLEGGTEYEQNMKATTNSKTDWPNYANNLKEYVKARTLWFANTYTREDEGFVATINAGQSATVTTYAKQADADADQNGVVGEKYVYATDPATGEITKDGNGQIIFRVKMTAPYVLDGVTAEPTENYEKLETVSDGLYRVTKVTGPISVKIATSEVLCEHVFGEDGVCTKCGMEAFKVTFDCDEHCTVTAFDTSNVSGAGHPNAAFAFARNKDTGDIDVSGSGQLYFVVNVEEGYAVNVEHMVGEPANYNKIKDPADASVPNSFGITKVGGPFVLHITTMKVGNPNSDYFADGDFDESAWEVLNPDTEAYSVEAGKGIVMPTQRYDIYSTGAAWKNCFVTPTDGDWKAVTKAVYPQVPNANYQQAMMLVWGDEDNYIRINCQQSSLRIEPGKETDGSMSTTGFQTPSAQAAEDGTVTLYWMIEKAGNEYTLSYSQDGLNFTSLGSTTADYEEPKIGLFATQNSENPSIDVYFEYLAVLGHNGVEEVTPAEMLNWAAQNVADYTFAALPKTEVDGDLVLPAAPHGYTVSVVCDHPEIIDAEGKFTKPATDTQVSVSLTVTNGDAVGTTAKVKLMAKGEAAAVVPIATYVTDEHCSVTAYDTSDLSGEGHPNATSAQARDKSTGNPIEGGQIWFVVNVDEGYEVDSVTAEPAESYNKLKDPADETVPNSYNLTKVVADVTITVTTKKSEDVPPVDKTALNEAVAAAEAVDKTKYTDETVAALEAALESAKAVQAAEDADQAAVDAAAEALNAAVDALEEKPEEPPVPPTPAGSYVLASEFVPGGTYVIVADDAFALNGQTVGSSLGSTAVTIEGDVITSEVTEDMLWTFDPAEGVDAATDGNDLYFITNSEGINLRRGSGGTTGVQLAEYDAANSRYFTWSLTGREAEDSAYTLYVNGTSSYIYYVSGAETGFSTAFVSSTSFDAQTSGSSIKLYEPAGGGSSVTIDFTKEADKSKYDIAGQSQSDVEEGVGLALVATQGGIEPAKQSIAEQDIDVVKVPVSGDWTATLEVEFDANGAANGYYQFFGFVASEGGDNQNLVGIRGGDGAMQDFIRKDGAITEETQSSAPGFDTTGKTYYLRIEKAGDTYTCYRSDDGDEFTEIFAYEGTGIEADEILIDAYTGMTANYKFTLKTLDIEGEGGGPCEHNWVAEVVEPTCTEGGYTLQTCSKCGKTKTTDKVPALGHDWVDGEVIKPATDTEFGEQEIICSRCGEKSKKTLLPNNLEEGYTLVKDPDSPTGYTARFVYKNESGQQVYFNGDIGLRNDADRTDTKDYTPFEYRPGLMRGTGFKDAMTDLGSGYWYYEVPLACGANQYWYTVGDSTTMLPDPANTPIWSPTAQVKNAYNYLYVPYDEKQDYEVLKMREAENPRTDGKVGTWSYVPIQIDGGTQHIGVYLPYGYDAERADPYKLIFILHGGGQDESDWMNIGSVQKIMDNLAAEGRTEPAVIVSPTTNANQLGGTQDAYANLFNVVLPFVLENYNVSKDKMDRAFGGLSMGSMNTQNIINAQTDAEKFGYYGPWSGGVSVNAGVPGIEYAHILFAGGSNDFGWTASAGQSVENLIAQGVYAKYMTVTGAHDFNTWCQMFRIWCEDYLWNPAAFGDGEPGEVDTTALEAAIAAAKAIDKAEYTDESVAAMDAAVEAAEAVLADENATQKDVDKAAAAVNNAVDALVKKGAEPEVNREALDAAIAAAEALKEADYTPETYKAVKDALEAAKAVPADADQAAVDAAAKALNDAIAALEEKPVIDRTELDKAIAAAEALKEADYTPETFKAVTDALAAAKAVPADADQAAVDAAAKAVNDAIAALEPAAGKADKRELAKAIGAAEAIDPEKYESVEDLNKALEAAKAVNDKDDATQDEVDAAAKAVTDAIAALKEKEPEKPFRFDDVKNEKSFYFKPVYWAYEAKPQITNGMTPTTFEPDGGCTRGQVVTFLWRAAGCPEPKSTDTPFTDVKAKAFYAKAVAWAVENGITKGMTDTTFEPDTTCTRGQIVTFLYRFKESPAPKSTETPFTDVNPKAFYAKAVAWAVEEGVTKGMTDTTFAPNDTCTRGQIVTFLYRAMGGK